MRRGERGFTLIELAIVVLILGLLAAIAIANLTSVQDRAREGSTRMNMHSFQIATEDESVQNNGTYPGTADLVAANLQFDFANPFDGATGEGNAWEDRATLGAPPSAKSGLVSYADSAGTLYNIKGFGRTAPLSLVLNPGQ